MRNDRDRPELSCDGTHAASWRDVAFVCSKCMKRQDRDVRGELKRALRRHDVRVVACGCLDLCPDDGVAVALGADLLNRPPCLRVVERKQAIDGLAAVVADLAAQARPHRA